MAASPAEVGPVAPSPDPAGASPLATIIWSRSSLIFRSIGDRSITMLRAAAESSRLSTLAYSVNRSVTRSRSFVPLSAWRICARRSMSSTLTFSPCMRNCMIFLHFVS